MFSNVTGVRSSANAAVSFGRKDKKPVQKPRAQMGSTPVLEQKAASGVQPRVDSAYSIKGKEASITMTNMGKDNPFGKQDWVQFKLKPDGGLTYSTIEHQGDTLNSRSFKATKKVTGKDALSKASELFNKVKNFALLNISDAQSVKKEGVDKTVKVFSNGIDKLVKSAKV